MARTIAPAKPSTPGAINVPQTGVDVSFIEKEGDAKIAAANNNYKLYAQSQFSIESNKAFQQFQNDPVQLSNALGKIQDGILSGLPEDLAASFQNRFLLNSIGLVQKAENNRLDAIDRQNREIAAQNVAEIGTARMETYANVLSDHIKPADEKTGVAASLFAEQQERLREIAELKDHNGNYIYTKKQRDQILDNSDMKIEAAKRFIDNMIINDDEDLTNTKDYYTKFLLAPERFMEENFMDRGTYDKVVSYAQKQLKQAGADIKNARFNQSIQDAMALQVENLPGKLAALKESGLIDKKLIKHIESTNVKFDTLNPAVADTPVAMIDALQIVNDWDVNPAAITEEQQQEIIEQGTVALDTLAEYAQKNGMTPKQIERTRQMVANKELSTVYADMINNFDGIAKNLRRAENRRQNKSFGAAFANLTDIDGMSPEETLQALMLNKLMQNAIDEGNQLVRQGRFEEIRALQRRTQEQAAHIFYPNIDWDKVARDPDTIVEVNGRKGRVKGYTNTGDIYLDTID